jgi:hypothetical protein
MIFTFDGVAYRLDTEAQLIALFWAGSRQAFLAALRRLTVVERVA